MKMIIAAALVAAATTPVPSFAQESEVGHYEWQSRPLPGPNKSSHSTRVRVRVKAASKQDGHHNCDMMRSEASVCMKMTSGKRVTHPKV